MGGDAMTYYKVLGEKGKPVNGGIGTWYLPVGKRPGKWMPAVNVDPCRSGYHLCDGLADLLYWLGPVIYEAEGRGETVRCTDKTVFASARLVRRVDTWNEHTARLFAADCAERVLPIYEAAYSGDHRPRNAIEAARNFARGDIGAAVWAAARDAAWAAAWAAAQDAAQDAAWAAAQAAAGDAERRWQADRLAAYLAGRAP